MDPDSAFAALQDQGEEDDKLLYRPAVINETVECLLWNPTCTGNRSEALKEFFNVTGGTLFDLTSDLCFTDDPKCIASRVPPQSSSIRSLVKSWMRQPACSTAAAEASKTGYHLPLGFSDGDGCCGSCGIEAPNVDVYYWPSPERSTECLSTIGTTVRPLLEGATTATPCNFGSTSGCPTYWGYTLVFPPYFQRHASI